jgi:hypothetical protein
MTSHDHEFDCSICAARAALHQALSDEVKAATQVYHFINQWRSAHEARELSNLAAEERTEATLAQFDTDTQKEAEWYKQYQESVQRLAVASTLSRNARQCYLTELSNYTTTRVAKSN